MELHEGANSSLISVADARLRLTEELGTVDWLVRRWVYRKRDLKNKKGQWVDRSSFGNPIEALVWQEYHSPAAILRLAIAEGELTVVVDGRADLMLPKDFFHRSGTFGYQSIVGGVLAFYPQLPPGQDQWEPFRYSRIYFERQLFETWLSKQRHLRRPDGMLRRKRGRPRYSKEVRTEAARRIGRGEFSSSPNEFARDLDRWQKRRYPYGKTPAAARIEAMVAPLWRAKAKS